MVVSWEIPPLSGLFFGAIRIDAAGFENHVNTVLNLRELQHLIANRHIIVGELFVLCLELIEFILPC